MQLSQAKDIWYHPEGGASIEGPDVARHQRHAGLHAANRMEQFHAVFMAVPHRFYVETFLKRTMLERIDGRWGCEAEQST